MPGCPSSNASSSWAWRAARQRADLPAGGRKLRRQGTAQEALDKLIKDWVETFEDDGKL